MPRMDGVVRLDRMQRHLRRRRADEGQDVRRADRRRQLRRRVDSNEILQRTGMTSQLIELSWKHNFSFL